MTTQLTINETRNLLINGATMIADYNTKYTVLTSDNQLKVFWSWYRLIEFLNSLVPQHDLWDFRYPLPTEVIDLEWEIIHTETDDLLAVVSRSEEVR